MLKRIFIRDIQPYREWIFNFTNKKCSALQRANIQHWREGIFNLTDKCSWHASSKKETQSMQFHHLVYFQPVEKNKQSGICTTYIHIMYKEIWIMLITVTYLGNMWVKVQTRRSVYTGPMLPFYWGYQPIFPLCAVKAYPLQLLAVSLTLSQFNKLHPHFQLNMIYTYNNKTDYIGLVRDQL